VLAPASRLPRPLPIFVPLEGQVSLQVVEVVGDFLVVGCLPFLLLAELVLEIAPILLK